jgi:myosin heavy subunit
MLKGADEDLLRTLKLTRNLEDYYYTGSSIEASNIPNISDESEFQVVVECLKGICDDNVLLNNIFRLLAGILHLGNVEFHEKDENEVGNVTEESQQFLNDASALFGLEVEDMITALSKQNMYVGNTVIVKVQSLAQVSFLVCSLIFSDFY